MTEQEIRNIVKEEIKKILKEGIDLKQDGDKRTVSVTNNHQNYVDTNDYKNPKLFDGECRGYRTISIFQRKTTEDGFDANPLLYALKGLKGWELGDKKKDLMILLKNFVSASKLLPKYDTIIMTASSNKLNHIVFNYLLRLVHHDYAFEEFFEKLSADEVYESFIDDEYIKNNFKNPKSVYKVIDDAFKMMHVENKGVFSYKYIYRSAYREAIIKSLKIKDYPSCQLNYAEAINGKDILVFDDTITTGKTISDSAEAIKEMFVPKSLTFITLFSALNKNN